MLSRWGCIKEATSQSESLSRMKSKPRYSCKDCSHVSTTKLKRRVAEINTDAQVEMQNQEGFELRYVVVVVTLNLCYSAHMEQSASSKD